MERKNRFRSGIRCVCFIAAMMLWAVVMTGVTALAAVDLSTGGSSFAVAEKHAYWDGGLRMSEFRVGTEDPVIGIFDLTGSHNFTPLTEGVDYNVVRIGRVFNHEATDVTGNFNKNLPGDYTFTIEGINDYTGTAVVDRFTLYDPSNPDLSTVPPADDTTQTTPAGGATQTTPTGGASQTVSAGGTSQAAAEAVTQKGTSIKKVTKYKKAFKVYWKKSTKKNATGYQIRYSLKPNMENAKTVTVKGYKSTSKKITKLKAKTNYYIQVRVYKTNGGKKCYSAWSKTKTVKTK